MFWYNTTLAEFVLIQHEISFTWSSDVSFAWSSDVSFAWSSDVRPAFASPYITCPGKINFMLDSVSSNKCLP